MKGSQFILTKIMYSIVYFQDNTPIKEVVCSDFETMCEVIAEEANNPKVIKATHALVLKIQHDCVYEIDRVYY